MASFSFKEWYEKNKTSLAERRKSRYQSDPTYRQAIKDRSTVRRNHLKAAKPEPVGISVQDACALIGVTHWTLTRWRNKGYLPVSSLRGARFSEGQVQLMTLIRQFFVSYPQRASAKQQDKLSDLVQVIAHNWS